MQAALDVWMRATRSADRVAFDSRVSDADPGFAARAEVWFTNLGALSDEVRLRAVTGTTDVSASRAELLGPGTWSQRVLVEWRLRGSREPAQVPVWLTVVPDGEGVLIASDTDAPATEPPPPRPTWLAGPVHVQRRGDVVVVGSGDFGRWLQRGEAAVAAVRSRVRSAGLRSSGPLVIEVPSTRAAFERSLGVGPSTSSGHGSYAGIGAVAWPRGDDRGRAAVHVVVNPEVTAGLSEEGVAVLLAHEATHVATRSPYSAAPTWLVEGFADHLAYAAYPATRRAAEEPLRRAHREGWRPTQLPPESAFSTEGEALDLAYAQSWSLCRVLSDRYSDARFGRFYARVGAGESVAAALRTEFGLSVEALVRAWRSDLERRAGS